VLGQALDWAQTAGLKVLVDLHGTPGSQNGFDNSGRMLESSNLHKRVCTDNSAGRGGIGWNQGDTIAQTTAALQQIVSDHASHPAVAGIQPVNEPMGPSVGMGAIQSFYTSAYDLLNTDGNAVVFHDAFETPQAWNSFLPGQPNMYVDTCVVLRSQDTDRR